jgi:cyanophycinase-like exopeptidase
MTEFLVRQIANCLTCLNDSYGLVVTESTCSTFQKNVGKIGGVNRGRRTVYKHSNISNDRQINISFTHKLVLYPVKFYLHVIYDNLYCHFLPKTWIVSFPYSVKSFSIETSGLNLIKNRTSKVELGKHNFLFM